MEIIDFKKTNLQHKCIVAFEQLEIPVKDIQSMFNELDKLGLYVTVHPMLDFSNEYANWSFEISKNTGFVISEGFGYLTRDEASFEAIKQALKIYTNNYSIQSI
jgi:hypothetical protein